MIEKQKELEITQIQLAKFEVGLESMPLESPENVDPRLFEAMKAGYRIRIAELKQEIADWQEKLERANNE